MSDDRPIRAPRPVIPVPVGRPSYYDPAFCERVIALGAEGKSEVQIAVSIGVPRETMRRWAEVNPDFRAALLLAKELSLAWWEAAGETGHAQDVIGPTVWKHSINNRFRRDYADRSETTQTVVDGGPADLSRLDLADLEAQERAILDAIEARRRALDAAKPPKDGA
jgi:hypothetical protein